MDDNNQCCVTYLIVIVMKKMNIKKLLNSSARNYSEYQLFRIMFKNMLLRFLF